ncbi:MAG: TonB-dependent receptor [Bryobacterales bacterium]|nr:TonB-dependent receptor [Bryobacterales bacterium]
MLLAFPLLFGLYPVAHAQEVRASITGIVADPTGAPVPGATVTVVNAATNVTVTTRSNESGSYVTPFLNPGTYEFSVEASGFKKVLRKDIVLQVGTASRIDVALEVGDLSQSVTVNEQVSLLQTETSSRSQILANEIVSNVPTQGRNPFQIAWAASGVVKSGSWRYLRSFDIGGTSGISINGGREKTNEVLLDGISNVRAEYTVISIPTTESVQEFKVQSNTYDAQYGRTGGGVVTIVTKGGGNDFHGTAFEYFQNDKLNANQTELNQPQTVAGVFYPNGRKPPNHINQFGATVSGPIIIPKVFNGKNKLFWMLSWESMRQRSADPDVKTVPQMNWRQGDFSDLRNAQGQLITIYDPYGTAPDGTRTPIAGNRIPTSRIDPIAAKVFSMYPAPTAIGDPVTHLNNYPYPSIWRASFDQFVGRTDAVINSKNQVFFRYNENPFQEYRAVVFGLDNPSEPTGNAPLLRNGRNVMMNWTSTLSPTMTFDLRFGLNRWEEAGGSSIGKGYDPKQLGFDPALVAQYNLFQFPRFDFDGGSTYQSVGSDAFGPGTRDTYSLQPNFNKVMGRHFFKFGVEARQYNLNDPGRGYPSGQFSFNRNWTQANALRGDAVSGNGIATFLLGIPSGALVQKNIDRSYRHFYYAGFFQDDWKLTQRLTVNFGLRYDVETGNLERYNRQINGLDLNAASPIASRVTGLTLKGAVQFANVDGVPRTLIDADKNNWQPRIGLAYKLHDKWVLRGGYGLYYIGDDQLGSSNGFSRQTNAIVSTDGGLNPIAGLRTANPFIALPNGRLLDPVGSSLGASSFLGEGVGAWMRTRGLPYTHQYSFDIQRELPGGILLEVGYGGNTTRRLPVAFGLNYLPTNELGRRTASGAIDTAYYTAQVPNPMAGLIPNNASLNGTTIQRQLLMYAYPQYSGISISSVPVGRNQFHGFNLKINKRFTHGLSFIASYNVGKNLQETRILNAQDFGGLSGWDNTKLVKESNQNIDAPQKFVIAGIYELPFGKGRPIGGSMNKVLNGVVGGWQLNYNVTYQSGWVVDYPNAPQNAPGSAKLDNPTMKQWFNTSLWKTASGTPVATQEPFTLRTFPYLFSDIRRPGYQNWDASLSKLWPVKERMNLQFRFEMVNMMNHPIFNDMLSTDVTNPGFGQLNPRQSNLPRFIKLGMHFTF